jgi:hypothetical protein
MRRTGLIIGLWVAGAPVASGQSLQRVSVQGSGALVFPTAAETDFQHTTRLGGEGQLRYTFSRFSLGAGYQLATVYRLEAGSFSGSVGVLFVEPRYVALAQSGVALYLAGRGGMGKLICSPREDCPAQRLEPVYGGGGGLLLRLSSRLTADLGTQYFSAQYEVANPPGATTRTGYVLARLGIGIGLF